MSARSHGVSLMFFCLSFYNGSLFVRSFYIGDPGQPSIKADHCIRQGIRGIHPNRNFIGEIRLTGLDPTFFLIPAKAYGRSDKT